jgi:hypothetical protein
MKKIYRSILKGFIVVLLFGILLLLFTPVGAFCSILFEELLVKHEINNPHVDTHFRSWKDVEVENFAQIRIPEKWQLSVINGIVYISTGDEVWAQGFVSGYENALFDTKEEFMKWMLNQECISITTDPIPGLTYMEGSYIGKFHTDYEDPQTFYYLCFENRAASADSLSLFLVLNRNLEHDSDHYDIAEAMIYAFAYSLFP